jgi:hypothetical protein
MLLMAGRPVPFFAVVIPLIWSLVGMSAAVNLRVPQDFGLVIAGIAGTTMILLLNKRLKAG